MPTFRDPSFVAGPSASSTTTAAAAGIAIVSAVAISALQFDSVSQRIMSGDSLQARRRNEKMFAMQRLLTEHDRKVWPISERKVTELVEEEEEMKKLANEIVTQGNATMKKKKAEDVGAEGGSGGDEVKTLTSVLSILRDESDVTDLEYYLLLEMQGDGGRKVRVPLSKFCFVLAERIETEIWRDTLCFVADASSSLGTEMIANILSECGAGVALVHEPLWMISLAKLIADNPGATGNDGLTKIITSLCRLEAMRVRNMVGESRTIVVTLPGQCVTAFLLPLLQGAFPCERHVYIYDSACSSVVRSSKMNAAANGGMKRLWGWAPYEERVRAVSSCVPLQSMRYTRGLASALSHLPPEYATSCETWMSSVDAFFKMKDEERKNGYLPFVLRLQFLLGDEIYEKKGEGEEESARLCLHNALQYILGARSRAIDSKILQSAYDILDQWRGFSQENPSRQQKPQSQPARKRGYGLTDIQKGDLEACIFTHKLILIADKTLLDTVQPAEKWTLKAAKKVLGCACCAPEEDEDEEEEEERTNGFSAKTRNAATMGMFDSTSIDESTPTLGLGPSSGGGRQKYVDGKTSFAFDPTAFGK